MVKPSFKRGALSIALVGIMAATLECVKLALASIPNVEAVTLFTALFAYVLGPLGVAASLVFVCIEPIIWGFGTWIISYFIYWPLVALVFMLLRRGGVRQTWLLTLAALILTLFFGVLSSLIDVGLFTGYYDKFFYRFGIYYLRGILFYMVQLAANAVAFPILFKPLYRELSRFGYNL